MGIFNFFHQDIAIDLGTANTIIIHNDKVVVDEPSIVAIERSTGKVIAVGKQAQQMHGKTHENIKTIRPLKDGVIADFNAAEHMIRGMIKMIDPGRKIFSPSLVAITVFLQAFRKLKSVLYVTLPNMQVPRKYI